MSFSKKKIIAEIADSLVMLTWSNWWTELKSNRYHYATRFARYLPVVFVQADLEREGYLIEEAGVENVIILHVYQVFGELQTSILNSVLNQLGYKKSIFWVYNCHFLDFIRLKNDRLTVYHATEAYYSSDCPMTFLNQPIYSTNQAMLSLSDIMIAVSEGVAEIYKHHNYSGLLKVVPNGCDYDFYAEESGVKNVDNLVSRKRVLYQGSIFGKLDYVLLNKLVKLMPEWTFSFCGPVLLGENGDGWNTLCQNSNVEYLGCLSTEELRKVAYTCSVGIIPFCNKDYLKKRSLPLKAYEYLACGLAVVSTPIDSLAREKEGVFCFAQTAEDFRDEILSAHKKKEERSYRKLLVEAAKAANYDSRFQSVLETILAFDRRNFPVIKKHKIVVLYGLPYLFQDKELKDRFSRFESFSEGINAEILFLPVSFLNELNPRHFNLLLFDISVFSMKRCDLSNLFQQAASIDLVKGVFYLRSYARLIRRHDFDFLFYLSEAGACISNDAAETINLFLAKIKPALSKILHGGLYLRDEVSGEVYVFNDHIARPKVEHLVCKLGGESFRLMRWVGGKVLRVMRKVGGKVLRVMRKVGGKVLRVIRKW